MNIMSLRMGSACAVCSLVAGFSGMALAAAPVLTPVCNTTVYVKEPVRLQLSATDADGGTLTYSVSGLPGNASVNASTGLLSWQPALTDTGARTAIFTVSDGGSQASMHVTMTVVMPALPADGGFKLLRPNGGEAYRYGDSLTVAWVMPACSYLTNLDIYRTRIQTMYNTCMFTPDDGIQAATDVNGARRGYCYTFQDRGMVVGFYRMAMDQASLPGCAYNISLGGDTLRVDSLYMVAYNQYGDEQGSSCTDRALQSNLRTGAVTNGPFSVVPRASWQPDCSAWARQRSVRPAHPSGQAIGGTGIFSAVGAHVESSGTLPTGVYFVKDVIAGRIVVSKVALSSPGAIADALRK
jgi:hypothetical protein